MGPRAGGARRGHAAAKPPSQKVPPPTSVAPRWSLLSAPSRHPALPPARSWSVFPPPSRPHIESGGTNSCSLRATHTSAVISAGIRASRITRMPTVTRSGMCDSPGPLRGLHRVGRGWRFAWCADRNTRLQLLLLCSTGQRLALHSPAASPVFPSSPLRTDRAPPPAAVCWRAAGRSPACRAPRAARAAAGAARR